MNDSKQRIGIIGVGRMGQPMVKHLRKHGYEVTAFDLSSDSCAKVQAMGAALPSNAAGGFWHRIRT